MCEGMLRIVPSYTGLDASISICFNLQATPYNHRDYDVTIVVFFCFACALIQCRSQLVGHVSWFLIGILEAQHTIIVNALIFRVIVGWNH